MCLVQDEFFPADLLFLSAENGEGLCYIETMQLDGETNLKIKKALDETAHITRDTLRGFTVSCRRGSTAVEDASSCSLSTMHATA